MIETISERATLDSIHFDTVGYEGGGDHEGGRVRAWLTPEGDGVWLHVFRLPPDLPCTGSLTDLRADHARRLRGTAIELVDVAIIEAAGSSAVRVVSKTPQEPSGHSYLAALTIPFRDFSFVVKVQCAELGMTGIREMALFTRRVFEVGDHPPGADLPDVPGWDPDGPEHDAAFPDHPLSRARRTLEHIRRTLVLDPALLAAPRFSLPPVTAA